MTGYFKTAFLLVFLTLIVLFSGYALGGRGGMGVAFVFSCAMNLGAYWFSDRVVLAIHRAQPLSEQEAPEVFAIAKRLSAKAGIPVPRLYLLPSAAANAFATGRDPKHAAIAITHGIVGLLNVEELEGVLAHELAHVLNRDILLSSIVATLAGALSLVASLFRWSPLWNSRDSDQRDKGHPLALLWIALVMPFVALLLQLAISRSREYGADARGARLCEDPLYLASALKKLDASLKKFPLRDAAPATAHLFILNPLSKKAWTALFGTHPPIESRITRLMAMSSEKDGGLSSF